MPSTQHRQQFQISCHSSKQNLETWGIMSYAGSFIFVMGKDKADLAAASAFSLPGMFTWLGIQSAAKHCTMFLCKQTYQQSGSSFGTVSLNGRINLRKVRCSCQELLACKETESNTTTKWIHTEYHQRANDTKRKQFLKNTVPNLSVFYTVADQTFETVTVGRS